jgi:excisionase family DNA binding protein
MGKAYRDSVPEDPDLWTLGQAADYLELSRKQLLELIRSGALRCVQRGLRFRVHLRELARYRERQAGS